MSRSHRKTPIIGFTTCRSERADKTIWHQRLRTHERIGLAGAGRVEAAVSAQMDGEITLPCGFNE